MATDTQKAGPLARFFNLLRDAVYYTKNPSQSIAELSRAQRLVTQYVRIIFLVARQEVFDRLKLHAQALTYDTLLAIVPLLAVVFAMVNGFGGLEKARLEEFIMSRLAGSPEMQQAISGPIRDFVGNIQSGSIGAISIVLLIFSVLSLLGHIENSFNAIFGATHTRPFAIRMLTYWAIVTLGPILLVASLGLSAALQTSAATSYLERLGFVANLAIRAMPLVITWIGFSVLYLVVPTTHVSFGAAIPAALVAGSVWNAAKWGYAIYAKHALSNQNIYGSLATIPVFILWLYCSWLLVLFGAHLAFAFQHVKSVEHGDQAEPTWFFLKSVAYRVLQTACVDFYEGKATNEDSLDERLSIGQKVTQRALGLLLDGGYLRRIDNGDAVVPARDPASITVQEVTHYLEYQVGAHPARNSPKNTDPLYALIQQADDARRKVLERATFRELAASKSDAKDLSAGG